MDCGGGPHRCAPRRKLSRCFEPRHERRTLPLFLGTGDGYVTVRLHPRTTAGMPSKSHSLDPGFPAHRTLSVCGGAHALHDGFTDLLNVLYPLLQAQFGLSYAAIGALKTVYSGAMASGQIPSGWLAGRWGGVHVLAAGTVLIAVGYGIAGLSGSLYGVVAGLLLAGLGGST